MIAKQLLAAAVQKANSGRNGERLPFKLELTNDADALLGALAPHGATPTPERTEEPPQEEPPEAAPEPPSTPAEPTELQRLDAKLAKLRRLEVENKWFQAFGSPMPANLMGSTGE